MSHLTTISHDPKQVPSDFLSHSEQCLLMARKASVIAKLSAAVVPLTIPVIHLGIISLLWKQYDFPVDRNSCTCSCWDTRFKGQYESGVGAYKHVYFNVNISTLKIWSLTVVYLLALYEVIKRTVTLFLHRRLRFSMFVLLASAIFPHYYSWWSWFNYWNDDYYSQWYHQLYFTLTELACTIFVVKFLDKKTIPQPNELLVIITVSAFHISASLYDQFYINVLKGNGQLHQVLRDLGFMLPDILHFVIPWIELKGTPRHSGKLFSPRELTIAAAFMVISWIYLSAF